MAKGTDHTGSTGRFGPRYGVRIRRRIRDIEEDQRDDHLCPGCGHEKVTREAAGIWQCDKCGHKFAGGAYTPETSSFRASQRQLQEALADEGSEAEEGPAGGQVLDEEETITPDETPKPEPETDDVPEETETEEDDELQLDDDVPEVDVPELEDIPEVEGFDEETEAELDPDRDADAETGEADAEGSDEDDDVVPEADLDLDRDEEE
jgi:large subunit ribosomal protein L37Ae